MHGHCDIGWFSCRQTRQSRASSVLAIRFILAISVNTASVVDEHVRTAITGVPRKLLGMVDRTDFVLDSMLWIPDLELAHIEFRCGA